METDPRALVPTCVWRVDAALIRQLDSTFGDPHDMYVNGSQVWLREDGPGGETLEWRMHPVSGYRRPPGMATEAVFERTAFALGQGAEPPVALSQLWDGLECFPAFGDTIEPEVLAAVTAQALGIEPAASGAVDHEALGDAWERAAGRISITEVLLEELTRSASGPVGDPLK